MSNNCHVPVILLSRPTFFFKAVPTDFFVVVVKSLFCFMIDSFPCLVPAVADPRSGVDLM